MPEVWKPVPGFPRYEASDQGRVKSLWAPGGKRKKPKIIGTRSGKRGYHPVSLRRNNKNYRMGVHRAVLLAFVGPCPDGMECMHLDNDKSNNCIENLKWGTRSENQKMRVKNNPESYQNRKRLSDKEVAWLKRLYQEEHYSQRKIAQQLGVAPQTVNNIVRGHSRAQITIAPTEARAVHA